MAMLTNLHLFTEVMRWELTRRRERASEDMRRVFRERLTTALTLKGCVELLENLDEMVHPERAGRNHVLDKMLIRPMESRVVPRQRHMSRTNTSRRTGWVMKDTV